MINLEKKNILNLKEELTKNASLTNKKLNLEKFKIVKIVNSDKKQKKIIKNK